MLLSLIGVGLFGLAFGGYSLHGGVNVSARNRKGLEALCRYIARPPLTKNRLVSDGEGEYRILLKTPKWKKLSRKDGSKSRHVAWAQLLWRSFGVMGWTCTKCGCMMRLRAIAIYPPATTKILRGLGVNLHGLGFTGTP